MPELVLGATLTDPVVVSSVMPFVVQGLTAPRRNLFPVRPLRRAYFSSGVSLPMISGASGSTRVLKL